MSSLVRQAIERSVRPDRQGTTLLVNDPRGPADTSARGKPGVDLTGVFIVGVSHPGTGKPSARKMGV